MYTFLSITWQGTHQSANMSTKISLGSFFAFAKASSYLSHWTKEVFCGLAEALGGFAACAKQAPAAMASIRKNLGSVALRNILVFSALAPRAIAAAFVAFLYQGIQTCNDCLLEGHPHVFVI